jgi:glycosyltransferase involved in cell wall biosynthesis
MRTPSDAQIAVLHVIVRANATNSQYNEHCLPVLNERRVSVCSLFPAEVTPPPELMMYEGDGTKKGSRRALRTALQMADYDVVHVHAASSAMLTIATYLRTRRTRRDLVYTVHNSWQNYRLRNRFFLYFIFAFFPTIVVCGNAALESMPRRVRRLFRRKLSVIPNGVDVDRIDRVLDSLDEVDQADNGLVVISVGRLIPLKHPETVLKAFVKAKGTRGELVFVGDGPMRAGMRDWVVQSALHRRVSFTGLIEREKVFPMMSLADVFVSASGGEGLPVSVLEAMACRCPVILSDIPPHREIVKAAPGIPLVPVGDVDGFARSIHRLLELEDEQRHKLGEEQRSCVVNHFSVQAMNNSYGEVYMRIIGGDSSEDPRLAAYTGTPSPDATGREPAAPGLLARMRRRWRLVAILTVLGALAGAAYSQIQPTEYQGTASVLVGNVIGGPADEDGLKASAVLAASYADLVRREPVLKPVAQRGFSEDWRTLQKSVYAATGDNNPQLVQITASAQTADDAESLAAAVADQLVALAAGRKEDPQQVFAERQVDRLSKDIVEIQNQIDSAQRELDAVPAGNSAPDLEDRLADLRSALSEQQAAYEEMTNQAAQSYTDDAKIEVLEQAYAARSPVRPDEFGLVGAGAGLGFALATIWVYLGGRRRRSPRFGDSVAGLGVPQPVRTDAWAPHSVSDSGPRDLPREVRVDPRNEPAGDSDTEVESVIRKRQGR